MGSVTNNAAQPVNGGGGSSILVINNLTTNSAVDALSAEQGVVLKALIDAGGGGGGGVSGVIDGGTPTAAVTTIELRRGTALQWTTINPILAAGEMGVETDTGAVKAGNGTSAWQVLPYTNNAQNSLSVSSSVLPPTVDAVNAALATVATPGLVATNTANDIITLDYVLGASDFDGAIRRITVNGAVVIYVGSLLSTLAATPGKLRSVGFLYLGTGSLEFVTMGGGVRINGLGGTLPASITHPLNGLFVKYGFYTLTQVAVGSNEWSLQ